MKLTLYRRSREPCDFLFFSSLFSSPSCLPPSLFSLSFPTTRSRYSGTLRARIGSITCDNDSVTKLSFCSISEKKCVFLLVENYLYLFAFLPLAIFIWKKDLMCQRLFSLIHASLFSRPSSLSSPSSCSPKAKSWFKKKKK